MNSSTSLLLALAGAFGWYTYGKKSNTSKTTVTPKKENLPVLESYKIVNCKLTVNDEQKMYSDVYDLAKKYWLEFHDADVVLKKIFGFCFSKENLNIFIHDQKNANYIFEMYKYVLSGMVAAGWNADWLKTDPETAMNFILLELKLAKIEIEKLGFDSTNLVVELINYK